jgi:hypothetical protein
MIAALWKFIDYLSWLNDSIFPGRSTYSGSERKLQLNGKIYWNIRTPKVNFCQAPCG